MGFMNPIDLPSWKELQKVHDVWGGRVCIKQLFKEDNQRVSNYSRQIQGENIGILFDYARNIISDDIMRLLFGIVRESNFCERRKKMFSGEYVNTSENRQVLHMALRDPQYPHLKDKGLLSEIQHEFSKMENLYRKINNGEWKGYKNDPIQHIVNIGIGGSDLGPRMATYALKEYMQVTAKGGHLNVHFVSNIDINDLREAISLCTPENTLFVIVSKTFTTLETLTNAKAALQWLLESFGSDNEESRSEILHRHFVAVSANIEEVVKFGIPHDDEHVFQIWDWVGGRYSIWSCVSLSLYLSIGPDNFRNLLKGGQVIDDHFYNSEVENNIPVIMALIGIYYNNFFRCDTYAILPYENLLKELPRYIQELDMESNGKCVTMNNEFIGNRWQTGPIVWGDVGTNGQHSFFQLVHQGTKLIPIDFLSSFSSNNGDCDISSDFMHHKGLFSSMLSQSEALFRGRSGEGFKYIEGNRPHNILVYERLDPFHLGAIIALYEYKVFVQGCIWNINSFDQFGVELGKDISCEILQEMDVLGSSGSALSASTVFLLEEYRDRRRM